MKSFIALLVVSTFAYLALSQSCTAAGVSSCISTPTTLSTAWATATGISQLATSCNSGFVMANSSGTCTTQCGTGCSWCFNASYCLGCNTNGYATTANLGVCVSCLNVTNAAMCTQSNGTVTVTQCATGYGLVNNTCISCTATSGTVMGITNCASCSGTITGVVTGSTTAQIYQNCTSCSSGYVLIPISAAVVNVSVCQNLSTASSTWTDISNNAASSTSSFYVGTAWGTSCTGVTLGTFASTKYANAYCSQPVSGQWCSSVSTFACTGTYPCTTTIANAVAGTYASTSTCMATMCASGYQAFGGACYNSTSILGCTMLATNTTCASVAAGYHLSSTGTVAVCSSSGCSSLSCATGQYLLANGTCATGGNVTNCLFHNSSTMCLVCQPGYVQPNPACLACSTNCVACNISSTGVQNTSTCATCGPNFVISSGACTAAPANSTSNSKVLLSGLAFISMIFYYIL